jgi:hypothetical protein
LGKWPEALAIAHVAHNEAGEAIVTQHGARCCDDLRMHLAKFVVIERRKVARVVAVDFQWAALVLSAGAQLHRSHFERPRARCATTLGGIHEASP